MMDYQHYTLNLTTLDPLRIGGKEDPLSEADNPVAEVGGRLCIPGATLKGAYRAELERWLNDRFRGDGNWAHDSLKPCIPSTRLSNDERQLVTNGRYRDGGCAYKSDSRRDRRGKDGTRDLQGHERTICPVCYLLGAMGLVGFVNVPFLFTDVSRQALYSARLERVSRTVMTGSNRAYQLVPPETVFTGRLEVLLKDAFLGWELGKPRPLKEIPNADAWLRDSKGPDDKPWTRESVLKEMIVDRIQAIARIGGYRSKGFGRVSMTASNTVTEPGIGNEQ